MDWLSAELCGFYGGILAELLGLFKLRKETKENFPTWLKSPFYWIVTIAMAFAGALLVKLYIISGFKIHQLIALNIGASAPLVIGALVAQAPTLGKVD